jgi:hypothetical protein
VKIPKPSDADRDRFRSLVPDERDVETKRMFGNLGAFVNLTATCSWGCLAATWA